MVEQSSGDGALDILFVGVLDDPASTNVPMRAELERRGHTVTDFNFRTISRGETEQSSYLGRLWSKATLGFRKYNLPLLARYFYRVEHRDVMNEKLVDEVTENDYDLVLLSKADLVDPLVLPRLNAHSTTWYWFMDPLMEAKRINACEYATRSTFASANVSSVVSRFRKQGSTAYYIPEGIDPDTYTDSDCEQAYNVVFVGSQTPERRRYINHLRNADISVTVFGPGSENGFLSPSELADVYQRSRIVLNFTRGDDGFSRRVFQAMGTRTFVLSEYCTDIDMVFENEYNISMFEDKRSLVNRIQYYLTNENERETIATRGHELVHNRYTWSKSIAKILTRVRNER